MVKAIINNHIINVEPGTSIIEAADLLQIPIARLCYHNKLSVAANCMVCLVEVKNNNLVPACATLITEGMEIFTTSAKIVAAQQHTMELLLANHPLECPVCDKAGECGLQDLSMQFGNTSSKFKEDKSPIEDLTIGALITTNMNRCINCTRCVRFSEEIAGDPELGIISGGDHIKITTFFDAPLQSELSGNMIDLCPVGALNSKPYQATARSWELQQQPGISFHDCIGSNINYHIHNEQIKRVVPKANNLINDVWIADRDRFSYTAINDISRLKHPLIKQQGKWQISSWTEAIILIKNKLLAIIEKYGAKEIGGLISPSATLEEFYLFQKLLRGLGSNNIDHRLRQIDFSNQEHAPCYPNLGLASIQDLIQQKCILLIGSYINKEQPIAGIVLRKAQQQGADIIIINPVDFAINCDITYKYIAERADLAAPLLQISQVMVSSKDHNTNDEITKIANLLLKTASNYPGKISIVLGALAINHPNYAQIVATSCWIAKKINATWGCLSEGANSAGAWLAGCVPHRACINEIPGKNALEMLTEPLKSYFLFGIEPELDCARGLLSTQILQQADLVVGFSSFESELLLNYAQVLLPINLPPEIDGTYINITGIRQQFTKVAVPPGISKAGKDILLELGTAFQLPMFINFDITDYNNIPNMLIEPIGCGVAECNNVPKNLEYNKKYNFNNFILISPIDLYAIDMTTRHAEFLQQQAKTFATIAYINNKAASLLKISNNEVIKITVISNQKNKSTKIFKIPAIIDNTVANGCVLIYQKNLATSFGLTYNQILLEKLMEEKIYV